MTLQKGTILSKIVTEFSRIGYVVRYKLIKAVEYGIPQKRERVIIIGTRKDIHKKFEYPQSVCNSRNYIPLGAVIDELAIEEKNIIFQRGQFKGLRMPRII